jgi:Fe-S cluster assembly protein SufD
MNAVILANEQLGAFNDEGFASFLQSRIDPAWLTELRTEAWKTFSAMEWPNPRDENWMRSELRGFKLNRYSPPIETAEIPSETSAPVWLLDGVNASGSVKSVNGRVVAETLDESLKAKGVYLVRCLGYRERSQMWFERLCIR